MPRILISLSSRSHDVVSAGGEFESQQVLQSYHNQVVVLGALMGVTIPKYKSTTSPLSDVFHTENQEEITAALHKTGVLSPDVIYRTPSSNGGNASVAGAGKWSAKLKRFATTMEERGRASVAGAGEWSDNLQRDAMTMEERGEVGGRASVAGAGEWSDNLQRVAMTMEERGEVGGLASSPLPILISMRLWEGNCWSVWSKAMTRSKVAHTLAELQERDSPELTLYGTVPSSQYWYNLINTGADTTNGGATMDERQAWETRLLASSMHNPLTLGKTQRVQVCFVSWGPSTQAVAKPPVDAAKRKPNPAAAKPGVAKRKPTPAAAEPGAMNPAHSLHYLINNGPVIWETQIIVI